MTQNRHPSSRGSASRSRWWSGRWRSLPADARAGPTLPDPEQAWKALALVNDLVRQAEAKLGVVLAAAGVSGGILFSLVTNRRQVTVAFEAAAVICAVSVFVAGASAMIGLYPRVNPRRGAAGAIINPLFFKDVADSFGSNGRAYDEALKVLTIKPEELVGHLSQQVHANAVVAQEKYKWANRAIRVLLVALLAIATLAVIVACKV